MKNKLFYLYQSEGVERPYGIHKLPGYIDRSAPCPHLGGCPSVVRPSVPGGSRAAGAEKMMFFIFYQVFWPSTIKNHIKNNDFWSNVPNWIDFKILPKFPKKCFGNFRPFFAIISYFRPFHVKVRIQNMHFHSTQNLEARVFASKLNFLFSIFIIHFFNSVVFWTYVTPFKLGQIWGLADCPLF